MARVGGASRQALHLLRPRHHQRAGESVGTAVQLNVKGLDPAHGLVAVTMQSLLPSFKLKVEIFKLDVTSNLNLWTAAHHWHIYSHLVGSCRLAALCQGLGHWQSQRSSPESAKQTRIHFQSGSAWLRVPQPPAVTYRWQLCTRVVSLSSCMSLHER
jgi:hypothetical protein